MELVAVVATITDDYGGGEVSKFEKPLFSAILGVSVGMLGHSLWGLGTRKPQIISNHERLMKKAETAWSEKFPNITRIEQKSDGQIFFTSVLDNGEVKYVKLPATAQLVVNPELFRTKLVEKEDGRTSIIGKNHYAERINGKWKVFVGGLDDVKIDYREVYNSMAKD
jgi:hypothetical protein